MHTTLRYSSIVFLLLGFLSSAQNTKLANEYYQQGDFEKALALYESLAKDRVNIPVIHSNYFDLLSQTKRYSEAEKYLSQITKWYPDNVNYELGFMKLYLAQEEPTKATRQFQKMMKTYEQDPYRLNLLGQGLTSVGLYPEAIQSLLQARKLSGRKSQYALDLAVVYRLANQKEDMIREYLLYAEENPYNLAYVKNILQSLLEEDQDRDMLETILISEVQKNPEQAMYSDLLIWLEIQRKNFRAAFIQGRAIDRRTMNGGIECMRIAQIAMENEAWDEAIEIYEYVVQSFPEGANYSAAKSLMIKSREEKVKSTFPIDKVSIIQLTRDYQSLVNEIGINYVTLEALQNKARLHAFYLDQKDSAIQILNFVIENKRSHANMVSSAKLDLGDIYLLSGMPWEATLLYSQVEKSNKESPVAFEAKLRNARLNYFDGNFALAKSHLDILKLATTREIANDAMALSLLIQNNTVFDSTDKMMQEYASIELLIFQNFKQRAESELKKMLTNYPGHSLTDEIHWQLSRLCLQRGDYTTAVSHLDFIINEYGYDILNDDAMYQKALILSDYLDQKEEALELFTEFLKTHPGSLYAAEVRKQIRNLRGDNLN